MLRIACLHTAESNIAVFDAALRTLVPGDTVMLRHAVRAELLADAEAAGEVTPEIAGRTGEALLALGGDADAVILTCSTLGPVADSLAGTMPALRVDAALAREAVRDGGKVVALCTVETTLAPTRALFEAAAATTGAAVEVRLVPGAWAAFRAGDRNRYLALVAEAADAALRGGATQVALAQASMAGAAGLATALPAPLTSPAAGLRAAIARATTGF
ncbi:MAG: Asp/Glu racemase [Rhizobiales bacterium]|nr:Asp/Glu racemase [Hyphomicrobiales bacterium]